MPNWVETNSPKYLLSSYLYKKFAYPVVREKWLKRYSKESSVNENGTFFFLDLPIEKGADFTSDLGEMAVVTRLLKNS